MHIHVWHGLEQRVGHLGEAQDDFNLLGEIVCSEGTASLSYALNGGSPVPLSVGNRPDGFGDARRLSGTGHFNADIPIKSLNHGMNTVVLIANDTHGSVAAQETVNLQLQTGSCKLPVFIDWSEIENPQDVGQYVDGKWGLQAGGLRVLYTGYDRHRRFCRR